MIGSFVNTCVANLIYPFVFMEMSQPFTRNTVKPLSRRYCARPIYSKTSRHFQFALAGAHSTTSCASEYALPSSSVARLSMTLLSPHHSSYAGLAPLLFRTLLAAPHASDPLSLHMISWMHVQCLSLPVVASPDLDQKNYCDYDETDWNPFNNKMKQRNYTKKQKECSKNNATYSHTEQQTSTPTWSKLYLITLLKYQPLPNIKSPEPKCRLPLQAQAVSYDSGLVGTAATKVETIYPLRHISI